MLLKGENANSIQKEMQPNRTLQKEKPRAESNDRKIVYSCLWSVQTFMLQSVSSD